MKSNFEEELKQLMYKEKKIPSIVRNRLDQSYEIIRAKSQKQKVHFIWRRVAAVACTMMITGVIMTNEHVRASIHEFFHFGDKGIEQAVHKGFTQVGGSSAEDKNIEISLNKHFADANKIGLSFQLAFKDRDILKNVEAISLDYRLKNGDGEYIEEFIPDTLPLKGENQYISGLEYATPILEEKTGIVQFDVLMESHTGTIPTLEEAVVEVESVNIFYTPENLEKVEGNWHLAMSVQNKEKDDETIDYAMMNETSIIEVSNATANPTSFNITFSLNGVYDDENTFAHNMRMIDEDGREYKANGFRNSTQNGKTIISTNFPITSYQNAHKLTFIIENIGEVDLHKK